MCQRETKRGHWKCMGKKSQVKQADRHSQKQIEVESQRKRREGMRRKESDKN